VAPRYPRLDGVIVHRARRPFVDEILMMSGLPVTNPARTLIDISPELPEPLLARVIDEGCLARIWTVAQLSGAAWRAGGKGRSRNGALMGLLELRSDRPAADSPLEVRTVEALRPLAPFEVHYELSLDGQLIILDVAWPALRVGLEADGFNPHSGSRLKFDQDRRKANLLLAHGWAVAHVTSAMTDREILLAAARLIPRWAAVGGGRRG
jgi:hypothetical protein